MARFSRTGARNETGPLAAIVLDRRFVGAERLQAVKEIHDVLFDAAIKIIRLMLCTSF